MQFFSFFAGRSGSRTSLYGLGEDSDQTKNGLWAGHWLALFLWVAAAVAGYYFLVLNSGLLEVELETDTRTVFKVYWPNRHGNFSERNMAELMMEPGRTHYALRVNNTAKIDCLRLDPGEKTAWVTIKKLRIRQWGYPDYQVSSRKDFEQLQEISGVESFTRHEQGVTVQVNSRDPQLKLNLPVRQRQFSPLTNRTEALRLIGVVLLATAGYFFFLRFFSNSDFIPVLAAAALTLAFVMAFISEFNTHPDEYVHVAAGKYFTDHTLPPKIDINNDDSPIAHTYSRYGVSRLHSVEIVYLLAGKYLRLVQPLYQKPFFLLRLFNVLLFASLIFFAFHKRDFRFFLLPFLFSSQIWYIFSYFNSDAFATVIGLLAAYQLAGQRSACTTLLFDEQTKQTGYTWLKILLLGLLFGLLLLLKKNFYALYLFFFCYFIWKIWVLRPELTGKRIFRFCAMVLIGCTVCAGVRLTDAKVNNFNKQNLLFKARQKYADRLYNPNTPLDKRHAYLQMRERGKTLQELLAADRWAEKSFRTSFGVYGYTQYSGSFSYYDYVRYTGLALLLTLIVSVFCRGGREAVILLAMSTGTALLLIGVACWHAWTVDFQAQGRYLLPIVPMLSVLLYHCRRLLFRPAFYGLFFALFSLSVYNFILVGLRDIGKYAVH
ncbi:MAG: hypothetical protein ACL93V_11100 [Candidatus Electrothrix sp. YB6]